MTSRRDDADSLARELGIPTPEKKTRRAKADTPAEGLAPPTTEVDAFGRLWMRWPEHNLEVGVDQIERLTGFRGGTQALFAIRGNGRRPLPPFRLNIHSSSQCDDQKKRLRSKLPNIDTDQLIDYLCVHVHDTNLVGESISAEDYEPQPEPAWLAWPLVLDEVANVWFANGGFGKTTLAVATCVSLNSGVPLVPGMRVPNNPVSTLFIDAEDSRDGILRIANAFADGAGLVPEAWRSRFRYRRLHGPLSEHMDAIQTDIERYDIRACFYDSLISMASANPNETDTPRLFFAATTIFPGVAVVGLTHTSKAEGGQPIASVMYRNIPRVVWQADFDKDAGVMGMFPDKVNILGPKPAKFQLALETTEDGIVYRAAKLDESEQLAKRGSVAEQIRPELDGGALGLQDIYDALPHLGQSAIRQALKREVRSGRMVRLQDSRYGNATPVTSQSVTSNVTPGAVRMVNHPPYKGVISPVTDSDPDSKKKNGNAFYRGVNP